MAHTLKEQLAAAKAEFEATKSAKAVGSLLLQRVARGMLARRPVLLVDDVMTTGATLFEAARCLSASGSGDVSALVLARVVRPREA